jgi:hypothetical protein
MDVNTIKNNKYKKYYEKSDLYWGLGIENETYFVMENPIEKTGAYIKKNRKRERYSVDYNNNYDQEKLLNYLNKIFLDTDTYKIPSYVNSHTLTKTDINEEHQTIYSVDRRPNSKYNGKTIHDMLKEYHEIFSIDFEDKYVFDGDTVEFITQNFYKATVSDCVSELISYKKKFLSLINHFLNSVNLPKYHYPKINYGLVQFKTNPSNVGIFNNGTYHINITLPTKLDQHGNIANVELFEKQHKNAIRLLQWVEPLIIAVYGSPDIFSFEDNNKYSAGSLRLTASRYIGIGTYDTNTMVKGKQLQDLKTIVPTYLNEKSWYNQLYKITDYKQGDCIGYDINYSKYHNTGFEFRILDYFPEKALGDLLNFILLLMDHSLENEIIKDVSESQEWQNFTTNVLLNGYVGKIPHQMINCYHKFVGFPQINDSNVVDYMHKLVKYLYSKYHKSLCSSHMSPQMAKPKLHNINRYMWENNYLQYIPINNKDHIRVIKLYEIYKNMVDSENSFILNKNNRMHNLLISTKLYRFNNLKLDDFYQKLLELSNKKIKLSKFTF